MLSNNQLEDCSLFYEKNGFAIVKIFSERQNNLLKNFASEWVYGLLKDWIPEEHRNFPLEKYHLWYNNRKIPHNQVFCAKNRFIIPEKNLEEIIVNKNLKNFFSSIGIEKFDMWNDGLGWLGFRLIRPGMGDGYSLSKKEWGPAKNVISCWIPAIGYTSRETLTVVPKSHLFEYEKILPEKTKFCKEEYRFAGDSDKLEKYQPNLNKGEVIFFHPKLLHSEDVTDSDITRLNLEVRFNHC